jgi:hypothetical protein
VQIVQVASFPLGLRSQAHDPLPLLGAVAPGCGGWMWGSPPASSRSKVFEVKTCLVLYWAINDGAGRRRSPPWRRWCDVL